MDLKETAARLNEKFMGADPQEAVTWFVQHYGRKAALSSSLSYEDQAVTAMMCRADKEQARVFTLDTGRQFPEFYNLLDRTQVPGILQPAGPHASGPGHFHRGILSGLPQDTGNGCAARHQPVL